MLPEMLHIFLFEIFGLRKSTEGGLILHCPSSLSKQMFRGLIYVGGIEIDKKNVLKFFLTF